MDTFKSRPVSIEKETAFNFQESRALTGAQGVMMCVCLSGTNISLALNLHAYDSDLQAVLHYSNFKVLKWFSSYFQNRQIESKHVNLFVESNHTSISS